jgi:cyclic pyranopterin phosphate synthase
MAQKPLTHVDAAGNARMVDVSAKPETRRRAVAEGIVRLAPPTLARIREGSMEKGDALAVARVAGIQGAKRTSDLVPLCHPVRLTAVHVTLIPSGEDAVTIRAEVIAHDRTGVEMEALTAVTAAALTLYDMVKSVDRLAVVESIRLLEKEGGKTGRWIRPA